MSSLRVQGIAAVTLVILCMGCDSDPPPTSEGGADLAEQPILGESAAAPLEGEVEGRAPQPESPLVAEEGGPAPTTELAGNLGPDSEQNATLSTGYGQITLENRTGVTLDLYIGSDYGCRALSNLNCTSQIREGTHTLYARDAYDRSVSVLATVNSGDSLTWTITEE